VYKQFSLHTIKATAKRFSVHIKKSKHEELSTTCAIIKFNLKKQQDKKNKFSSPLIKPTKIQRFNTIR